MGKHIQGNFITPNQAALSEIIDKVKGRRDEVKEARSGHEEAIAQYLMRSGKKSEYDSSIKNQNDLFNKLAKFSQGYEGVNSVIKCGENTVDLKPYLEEYSINVKMGVYKSLNGVAQGFLKTDPLFYDFVIKHLEQELEKSSVCFQPGSFNTNHATFGVDFLQKGKVGVKGPGCGYYLTVDLCPICSSLLESASSASYKVSRSNEY